MDAVITYVNGLDPVWQKEYASAVGMDTFLDKRFRDWGTLKYLLRGIQTCMPFVRNVFLIVSGDTQVPQWADTANLHVVRHSDIIPQQFLPVFNSTAIEMFMHRIEGLDEEFLYFNDDFFPVMPFSEHDFFTDGKPSVHPARQLLVLGNEFRNVVRRSCNLAREALGMESSSFYYRPQHTVAPMLRSQNEELYSRMEEKILSSITPLRQNYNYNQYIYTDYVLLKGLTVDRKISNKHFSLAVAGIDKIVRFIDNPDRKMVCINDVKISASKYATYREQLLAAFKRRFPVKSRFEK
jgi:hypothetical protein